MGVLLVGAGLPRTGTKSLKKAIEVLTGGRCYHALELVVNRDHIAVWRRALAGDAPDWQSLLSGYVAIVDWPGAALWRELSAAYPDASVLLSTRSSARQWWRSFQQAILPLVRDDQPPRIADIRGVFHDLRSVRSYLPGLRRSDLVAAIMEGRQVTREIIDAHVTIDWSDEQAAMAAYHRHNDAVRAAVRADRLVEWTPEDGWPPLCRALGLPAPDGPFPHI